MVHVESPEELVAEHPLTGVVCEPLVMVIVAVKVGVMFATAVSVALFFTFIVNIDLPSSSIAALYVIVYGSVATEVSGSVLVGLSVFVGVGVSVVESALSVREPHATNEKTKIGANKSFKNLIFFLIK